MLKFWSKAHKPKEKILWLDLGDLGDLINPDGPHEQWQDHGLGLLRTILHQNEVMTDILSTRAMKSWDQLRQSLPDYEVMIMNVRSYTFPVARKSAKIFKEVNPNGLILAGGMHATVALDEMTAVPEFDRICQGPGEKRHCGSGQRSAFLPPGCGRGRLKIDGRMADDRPHLVAPTGQP